VGAVVQAADVRNVDTAIIGGAIRKNAAAPWSTSCPEPRAPRVCNGPDIFDVGCGSSRVASTSEGES